jgi:hypothetical protein
MATRTQEAYLKSQMVKETVKVSQINDKIKTHNTLLIIVKGF